MKPEAATLDSSIAPAFPPGTHNAFLFAVFNAMSFQIVQRSPMVLCAKSLGASATLLGIIAGMMPLLVIFQIPAASHVNRIGYQRFVLGGWSTRVVFIFAAAAGVFVSTLICVCQLDEPEASSTEELLREILIQSPQKFWLRFWPRG